MKPGEITMDHNSSSDLVVVGQDDGAQLHGFEKALLRILEKHDLPIESIFVPIDERDIVFKNIENVLKKISPERKPQSIYLSKFVAAVAAGLFDAALNYLWDETIFELRRRVAQYDLSYFFDNAIPNVEKRKKLSSTDDLKKIEDSELIYGAREIELISELGFKHLDYIRYMRNWASAAHPNQNMISGLQLISWLETCIKEVISLPLSNALVEIRQLLTNIKSISISDIEAREIATSCLSLTKDQINNVVSGFFGIYSRPDTTPRTRQNIRRILPLLWDRVDEPTRQQVGNSYGKYASIGDQERKNLSREFLELVSATPYIPDEYRVLEIEDAIENLLLAHRGLNNFYNEPAFARALTNIVGPAGKIPKRAYKKYVFGLVEVFLTNGNGVAWNAEPIYLSLINLFDAEQALIAILSFNEDNIASSLQFELCQKKYLELLDTLKINVSAPAVADLIEDIQKFEGPLDRLRDDHRIKQKLANLLKIIG